MTKEELEKEAENFIIDRYKLNECYREDNAETREYMRMDVHSQYEEEYQLYLAVAEPREKQIVELEKENAELKKTYRKQRNKRIDELQKENAELKDYRLTTLAKQQTEMSEYALNLEHKLSWYDNQLTKAKELLKQWIELYKPKLEGYPITAIQEQTEQFLKDSEVEK